MFKSTQATLVMDQGKKAKRKILAVIRSQEIRIMEWVSKWIRTWELKLREMN